MVGYGPTVAYAVGTVGAEVTQSQSQVKHLWAKLRTNQTDVRIMVVGDSTGNATTEWVYLTAQWLATKCPTHTVKYRLWGSGDGSTQVWGSYSTIQTGSGATLPDTGQNTIWVDNASISGINHFYTQGARESLIWDGSEYDLVISNFGHNLGTAMTEDIALPEWICHLSHVRHMAPRAGLLVTLQNPRTSITSDINTNGSAQSARMVMAWRKAADMIGAGLVDVYSPYKALADASPYMGDETHPNDLGQSTIWLPAVQRAMAEPRKLDGVIPQMANPLSEQRPNFAPNPRFSRWTATAPDGWTFTNCTPVKNVGVTEGSLYSLEVQITAGADPKITTDLTAYLGHLRGKTITAVARIRRPAGLDLLAGRIALESTDNVTNPSFTSYPRGTPSENGWEWAIATLTVPRAATALQLRIYAGAAAGTDNGEKFYLDSVSICEGVLPSAVGFEDITSKSVTDFYNDANAGLVTGNTGTLTAVSGTLTLTGAPSGYSDTYINLPGLTPGATYKVTFNGTSCTGNTAGGCYMRNGFDGGSTELSKASGTGDWTAGGGVVTFTFVAPSGAVSIRPYGYTGATGYVMTSWSVTKTLSANTSQFPQNSQSAAYTLIGTDAGKHLLHPSADTTARVWTIPANASVDYPIGTTVTFVNQASGGVITISITTDTMRLAGAGTTGSRTLAANGVATALKLTATEWIIYGTGLT
jgi:hypothetical protein